MEQVGLISRDAAVSWKTDVDELNERTRQALDKIHEVLDRVGKIMQGSLADELVSIGAKVATATHALVNAMKKILEVVDNILSSVSKAIQSGLDNLGKIASTLL